MNPGDPCRIDGIRGGRFRFLGYLPNGNAEVIGPIGKREISRVVKAERVLPVRDRTSEQVEQHPEAVALSRLAHANRRKKR